MSVLDRVFDAGGRALMVLSPEAAHDASLRALEIAPPALLPSRDVCSDALVQDICGLTFRNPVGLAAGYDKDARVPHVMLRLGMGFTEIGTVTPKPQDGNPKPRVFRLSDHNAVINRLGFNNAGHAAALARLKKLRRSGALDRGVLGVNIGANKDSLDRAADYALGVSTFADVADYFTVNISSPNTPGLRDLQAPAALGELLDRIFEARAGLEAGRRDVPIFVKLSPDIADADLPAIVDVLTARGVSGIIVTNTTLARDMLDGGKPDAVHHGEAGGLSGAPLMNRSTRVLAGVYRLTEGSVPLIGVGGITRGEDAVTKIKAGASLVQVYTGLIYRGPSLIGDMCAAMERAVRTAGVDNISALVGIEVERWAD